MTKKVAANVSVRAQKESLDKNLDKRKRSGKSKWRTVISRDVLLAGRVLCMQKQESEPVYCLKALSYAPSSRSTTSELPGLTKPPGLDLTEDPEAEGLGSAPFEAGESQPEQNQMTLEESEPEEHKVLLRNLPDSMLSESMLQGMLDQAQITDTINVALRSGKALLTFASYDSAHKCVMHCNGRLWSNSTIPVGAMYVRTVKKQESNLPPMQKVTKALSADAPTFVPPQFDILPQSQAEPKPLSVDAPEFVPPQREVALPQSQPETKSLSADAPAFVPGSFQIPKKTLSPEAPVFVPSAVGKPEDCAGIRNRCISSSSTASGVSDKVSDQASEECDSEPEVSGHLPPLPEVPVVCT